MKLAVNILFFLFLFQLPFQSNSLRAQDQHTHEHQHAHDHSIAHNEIALGGGIALISENPNPVPSFHLHAIKGLTPHFGLGIGYEIILGSERHQSLALMANFRPIALLDLNLGPGVVFPMEDESWTWVVKAESALAFKITEGIHAGPLLDLAWSGHGFHLITGLHIGIDL